MIAIVTDSTAYLTHEEAVELGVVIVPMSYSFGKDMSLNEGCIENDEHAERQVAEGIDHVHTSQATLAGFFNAFQRLRRAGYEVLCITISSRLSGTYANAVLAAKELGGGHIEVVDSLTTCSGLYLLIREARKRIREGAQRLGITCIETAAVDGRAFREEWAGKFDVVICDVPCSGLGIIRKKPDIRYKDVQEFSALPEIQRAILENSARYVKRGGLLVYSTCTILPEENEQVTDDFLKAHDEFTYEAFSLPNGVSAPGHLTLWPQRDNTDGFYLSRMRRKTHD